MVGAGDELAFAELVEGRLHRVEVVLEVLRIRLEVKEAGYQLAGMLALFQFLRRSYTGAAIRAIAQDRQIMPLMGVDTRRIYLVTSAIGGALAGLAACLLILQYDVHPFIGNTFGPLLFMICVLGGLGDMIGGFAAAASDRWETEDPIPRSGQSC